MSDLLLDVGGLALAVAGIGSVVGLAVQLRDRIASELLAQPQLACTAPFWSFDSIAPDGQWTLFVKQLPLLSLLVFLAGESRARRRAFCARSPSLDRSIARHDC